MTVAPSVSLRRSRAWVCVSVKCPFPGGAPLMSGGRGGGAGSPHLVMREGRREALACGLGPAPSFGGPLRDEGGVGSGEPAQGGGLAGERLIVPAL
jgi:hypothetical protein